MSGLARHRGAMWLGSLLLLLGAFYMELDRAREGAGRDAMQASVARAPSSAARTASFAKPLRVLFVGNSLTSTHGVPNMVARLAEGAREPRRFEFRAETFGGFGLTDHLSANRVQAMIAAERWDAVVLQEQGQRPGWPRTRDADFFAPARLLDGVIRRAGSKTVFYETYARREGDFTNYASDTYAAMQRRVGEGYGLIARELDAELVPVGTLWARCAREHPALRLWEKDGMHASPAGAYLAASAFYTHFYRKSPAGNPYTANLNAGDALVVQTLAASILQGPLEVALPSSPAEPQSGSSLPAPSASRASAPVPAPAHAAADAERDRARRDRILSDMKERDLQAARSRVSVTLYKTSWCGPCQKASAYMREHDIACLERDVETDPGAREDAQRLNPRGSVPTIDVDGQVLVGWSEQRFESVLDRAARARAKNL